MTTNRVADVDDAILSRCIAHIKYSIPNNNDRRRLWEVLGEQFQAPLTSELIAVLCEKYNTVGGRDIKELLKLALKFSKGKKLPMSEALFVKCAQFRGL
jgi:AAA+ superfamily predicted ATPase